MIILRLSVIQSVVSSLSGVVARKRPKALETNMSLLQDAKPS